MAGALAAPHHRGHVAVRRHRGARPVSGAGQPRAVAEHRGLRGARARVAVWFGGARRPVRPAHAAAASAAGFVVGTDRRGGRLHVDHQLHTAAAVARALRPHREEPARPRPAGPAATARGTSMTYLVVKWLHILSSTLLFGTGLGSAFYMFFASRTRDVRVIAVVVRYVVIADWVFTTPTVILQPITGFWLA